MKLRGLNMHAGKRELTLKLRFGSSILAVAVMAFLAQLVPANEDEDDD